MINTEWLDAEKTAIVHTPGNDWTADEMLDAFRYAIAEVAAVPYRVPIIFDMRRAEGFFDVSFFTRINEVSALNDVENTGLVIFIGVGGMLRRMVTLATAALSRGQRYIFVDTLEQATQEVEAFHAAQEGPGAPFI